MQTKLIRLFSALLSFCICCALLPSPAHAVEGELLEESDAISMRIVNDELSVTYSGTASSVKLVAAGYDENGKMVSAQMETAEKNQPQSFLYDGDYSYQVIALDPQTWTPVCKSCKEITLLDGDEVSVPMIDGAVASAVNAAVSQCAAARLKLEQLLAADVDAVEGNKEKYDELNAQIDEALAAYDQLLTAGALLWSSANGAADKQEAALAALMGEHGVGRTLAVSEEDQLHWAQQLTEKYDAIQGNRKLAELGKMMGCDAREAYRQLTAAQDVLRGKYLGEAESAERWVKGLTVVKTSCKVGLYVGGAIITGGVAVAGGTITAGSVTALEATGLIIGGVDTAIDVSTTTATVILGSDHKLVEIMEKKAAPISAVASVFSFFTLSSQTTGEKIACFGDFMERTRNLYNDLTSLYNWKPDLNSLRANAKAGKFLNPEQFRAKVTEEMPDMPAKVDAVTLEPAVIQLQNNQGGAVTPEKLVVIFADAKTEGLIQEEKTIEAVTDELKEEITADELSEGIEYELPMEAEGPLTTVEKDSYYYHEIESYNEAGEKHGLWQKYYHSTGNLAEETYYLNGVEQWWRGYNEDTGALSRVLVYDGVKDGWPKRIREEWYFNTREELDALPAGVTRQPKNIWQFDPVTEECILSATFSNSGILYLYESGASGDGLHGYRFETGYGRADMSSEWFDTGNMRYKRTYYTDPEKKEFGHIAGYYIYDLSKPRSSYGGVDAPGLCRRIETWEWNFSEAPHYYHETSVFDESGKQDWSQHTKVRSD